MIGQDIPYVESGADPVYRNWGGGQPSGKVAEIKAEKAEVMSNKGNVISKNGTEDDPAVIIERPGVGRCH